MLTLLSVEVYFDGGVSARVENLVEMRRGAVKAKTGHYMRLPFSQLGRVLT